MANVHRDLGPVSAYAIAVKYGYKGTEAQWAQQQVQAGENAAAAAASAKKAAETLAAVEQTVAEEKNQAVEAIAAREIEAVEAVEAQEAASAQAVQEAAEAAGTAQEARIAAKGEQTLQSIPEEYTELDAQVKQNAADILNKAPAIVDTVTGPLCMTDIAAAQPAVSLISNIAAVQSGSGDPSPSNVRPITGWEEVSVKNETSGQSLTADLPETIYGGTLDWTTGVLTVTHGGKVLDGADMSSYLSYASGRHRLYVSPGMLSGRHFSDPLAMCDKLVKVEAAGTENSIKFGGGNPYISIEVSASGSTKDSLAAWLADNPLTITSPLATLRNIQLTPQQLDMLKGANAVWSDCGETVVAYVADTKLYIDGKFAALEAAILSTGANV